MKSLTSGLARVGVVIFSSFRFMQPLTLHQRVLVDNSQHQMLE